MGVCNRRFDCVCQRMCRVGKVGCRSHLLGRTQMMINLIMASAFASILIYAMDLLPNRIGLIGGLFYGLNFGLGGIAAAILGVLAESHGVEPVFRICAFLPLAGLLAWFLPRIDEGAGT